MSGLIKKSEVKMQFALHAEHEAKKHWEAYRKFVTRGNMNEAAKNARGMAMQEEDKAKVYFAEAVLYERDGD